MGITITGEIAKKLDPRKIMDFVQRTPQFLEAMQREETELEAKATQDRIRQIDYVASIIKERGEVEKKIEKQKPVTDRARDAFDEQAAKLDELERRFRELNQLEGAACSGLAQYGEGIIEEACTKLDAVVRHLAREVKEMQNNNPLMPEGKLENRRKIERYTEYHAQTKDALAKANSLRMARISPAELAAKAADLLAIVDNFALRRDDA